MSVFRALKKIDSLNLPDELISALEQSGVLNDPNGLSWLADSRIPMALAYVAQTYTHKTKKFGNAHPVTHPLWVGYRSFHAEVIQQQKASPHIAAFLGITHDSVEEARQKATTQNVPFDDRAILDDLTAIWDSPKTFRIIRAGLEYMTDNPALSKEDQLKEQIRKSFHPNRQCRPDTYAQLVRFFDKLEQLRGDIAEHKKGNLPDEKLPRQLWKAQQREYVKHLPCALANKGQLETEYTRNLFYLTAKAQKGLPVSFRHHRQRAGQAPKIIYAQTMPSPPSALPRESCYTSAVPT